MLPDYEGCLRLLVAHARLWLRDAQHDAKAWAELADWLEMTPDQLHQRLEGPHPMARESAFYRVCPGCRQALPEHNKSVHGAGRQRQYCNDRCRRRAAKRRKEDRYDTQ